MRRTALGAFVPLVQAEQGEIQGRRGHKASVGRAGLHPAAEEGARRLVRSQAQRLLGGDIQKAARPKCRRGLAGLGGSQRDKATPAERQRLAQVPAGHHGREQEAHKRALRLGGRWSRPGPGRTTSIPGFVLDPQGSARPGRDRRGSPARALSGGKGSDAAGARPCRSPPRGRRGARPPESRPAPSAPRHRSGPLPPRSFPPSPLPAPASPRRHCSGREQGRRPRIGVRSGVRMSAGPAEDGGQGDGQRSQGPGPNSAGPQCARRTAECPRGCPGPFLPVGSTPWGGS